MANNNINFNNIVLNGTINLYPAFRAEKVTFTACNKSLSEAFKALDTMAPGVFTLDKVKGGALKLSVSPDAENLTEILVKTGDERKACVEALTVRNASYETMVKAKKAAFDLVPDCDLAFLDLSESGDESEMESVWKQFLTNLGLSEEDANEKAIAKFMNRVIPTLNPGRYSDKGMDTTFKTTKGMTGKEQIWRALHNYLLHGLPTRCKEANGEYKYVVGKNGRKTTKIETIITGGGFTLTNDPDGKIIYANAKQLKEDKAEAQAQAVA